MRNNTWFLFYLISVNRLKDETGVVINIIENEGNNVIRIEGSHKGVADAERELREMVMKLENERTKEVYVDHRYIKSLIGVRGEKIKEIREKFDRVLISLPDQGQKRSPIKLRGPQEDIEKCEKYLHKVIKEISESSYVQEVPIFKQFHKFIIGKGGANLRKIRDETQTIIDLPAEGDDSDVITVRGKRDNVEEAVRRIQQIHNEKANIVTEEVTIAPKYYNSLIGAGGKLIHSIMEECGGVLIKFPPADSDSDKVVIKGPIEDVEKAKQQLLAHASERELTSHTATVRAKPEHHKFLIGKNGTNIKKIREQTGARIVFPTEKDEDKEAIFIIGKSSCYLVMADGICAPVAILKIAYTVLSLAFIFRWVGNSVRSGDFFSFERDVFNRRPNLFTTITLYIEPLAGYFAFIFSKRKIFHILRIYSFKLGLFNLKYVVWSGLLG